MPTMRRPSEHSVRKKTSVIIIPEVSSSPRRSPLLNTGGPEGFGQMGLQNNLSNRANLLDNPIAKVSRLTDMPGNLQSTGVCSGLYDRNSGSGT